MPRTSGSIPVAYLAKHGIEAPKRPGGNPDAGKAAEEALYGFLRILGIEFEPQYPWGKFLEPPRKYHSDAAIPSARLLIEIDGGIHGVGEKRERDLARQNLGTFAGWHFLRFTPEQAKDGTASLEVERYLKARGHR